MTTPSPDQDETARVETDVKPSAHSRSGAVQFAPGTIIAGRYRISAILGSGGMGEVYRADDTKLDQPLALKFLPARLARVPILLGRLHDEVRLGRQIAHPNVCRIYDIVEWEGAHFVAMEYVDGEDLSRLLRRIGRLPSDKAIDIARGIAAGLLAAHAKGILHRDLKPANVMLDSRGDARITDFGLALSASDDQEGEIAGTPAYMAPEQLQGAPATVQSDLYALGLLMYELFTGKRVHAGKTLPDRLREMTSEVPTPSEHIRDLDPAVERVILRCLSSDPTNRPRSAREVIEALPGGDPLAAAMAAGETPSPRIVAAAGAKGSLRRGVAWTLLSLAMLLATATVLALRGQSLSRLPFDRSPEVLHDRAQIIARDLGVPLPGKPLKQLYMRPSYLEWLTKRDEAGVGEALRKGPGPILFRIDHGVTPAELRLEPLIATAPGRTSMDVDTSGRLSALLAAPDGDVAPRPLDWNKLLRAAGLSLTTLEPLEPRYAPPVPFDARATWSGTYPGDATPIRVEAAAWHGMPVYFRVTGDWEPKNTAGDVPAPLLFVLSISVILIAATALLAWRNLRLRRGDRAGALRVGMAMSVIALVCDLLMSVYSSNPLDNLFRGFEQLGAALGVGLIAYVMYLAIEPYLRRRWADRLIAWSRLLAGRLNDPMVGRDTLIGVVAGTAYALLSATESLVSRWTSSGSQEPNTPFITALLDIPSAIGVVGSHFPRGGTVGFLCMTVLVVATIVLRNRIAAGVVLFALILPAFLLAGDTPVPSGILSAALLTWIPYRYGLLASSVMITSFAMLFLFPAVPAPWATSLSAISYATCAALALWAFRTSLGGQSPFGAILEEP